MFRERQRTNEKNGRLDYVESVIIIKAQKRRRREIVQFNQVKKGLQSAYTPGLVKSGKSGQLPESHVY